MAPAATSRVASGHTSRAGSSARDILKKRDKPYKTEQNRVVTKKRKLQLSTAGHNSRVPHGYTFLPVGTPDLAERCKELSRQKGYPVNVVNSKPVSTNAMDPEHVSHHIARIGYHFRSDVLDEARRQLGYIICRGHFVKEAELDAQRQHAAQQSAIARTFAKFGVPANSLAKQSQRESPDQVKAAIKELFPKIPDKDLGEIVAHAWKEGSDRVGTRSDIQLSRRVQLATIARIRHQYTDYDKLLRAFPWSEAREIVEPDCLQKLIEWRGEQDVEDDDELEEIVRETIVIDDDDDSDDDSVAVVDGDTSDASIEIIEHGAADHDFGAESAGESTRRPPDRYRPRHDNQELRHAMARQKIGAARERIRAGVPLPRHPRPPSPAHTGYPPSARPASQAQLHIQPDQYGRFPDEVIVDGRLMRLVPAQEPQHRTPSYPQTIPVHNGAYAQDRRVQGQVIAAPPAQRYAIPGGWPVSMEPLDRPIASIERDDHVTPPDGRPLGRAPPQPTTPKGSHALKRRYQDELRPGFAARDHPPHRARSGAQPVPAHVEVIDLLSPVRPGRGTERSPMLLDDEDERNARRYAPPSYGSGMHTRPIAQSATRLEGPPDRSWEYPSRQPQFYAPDASGVHSNDRRPNLYHPGAEPVRQVQYRAEAPSFGGPAQQPPPGMQWARVSEGRQAIPPGHQPQARSAQQPIHGAPAPVQQAAPALGIPRDASTQDGGRGNGAVGNGEHAAVHHPHTNGAVAPTQQYYYAR